MGSLHDAAKLFGGIVIVRFFLCNTFYNNIVYFKKRKNIICIMFIFYFYKEICLHN